MKSLAGIAAATGLSVTPVARKGLERVGLVYLMVDGYQFSDEDVERLHQLWEQVVRGSALEGVEMVALDSSVVVRLVKR